MTFSIGSFGATPAEILPPISLGESGNADRDEFASYLDDDADSRTRDSRASKADEAHSRRSLRRDAASRSDAISERRDGRAGRSETFDDVKDAKAEPVSDASSTEVDESYVEPDADEPVAAVEGEAATAVTADAVEETDDASIAVDPLAVIAADTSVEDLVAAAPDTEVAAVLVTPDREPVDAVIEQVVGPQLAVAARGNARTGSDDELPRLRRPGTGESAGELQANGARGGGDEAVKSAVPSRVAAATGDGVVSGSEKAQLPAHAQIQAQANSPAHGGAAATPVAGQAPVAQAAVQAPAGFSDMLGQNASAAPAGDSGPSSVTGATKAHVTTAVSRPDQPSAPASSQVAVHLSRAAQEGLNRLSIQLNPAELGRVDVKIEVGHDGRAIAMVAADRPETLDMLQRDARTLERALQDAGLQADSDSLNFSLRQDGRDGEALADGRSRAGGGRSGSDEENGGDARKSGVDVLPNLVSTRALDISV